MNNELKEIAQMLEENRHARWEHKRLRRDMKNATIIANLIALGLIVLVIVIDVLRVKMTGVL